MYFLESFCGCGGAHKSQQNRSESMAETSRAFRFVIHSDEYTFCDVLVGNDIMCNVPLDDIIMIQPGDSNVV